MEFTKDFFQTAWGESGYYEHFSYGVGIDKVCEKCIYPFWDIINSNEALEIGSGGGVFTEKMVYNFLHLTAIDVIKMPDKFKEYSHEHFTYIELPDGSYDCPGIENNSVDFCFSYNTFCHLSNEALKEYFININRVLKPGADFVFMLANYEHTKKYFRGQEFKLGDLTPVGHYYQDSRTLNIIAGKEWEIINPNMIPEHRDVIVHLKKK